MITMDLVRDHLKIDAGDDDAVLKIYVSAAVQAAEKYTGRRLRAGFACDVYECPRGMVFRLKAEPTGPVTAKVYLGTKLLTYPASVSGGRAYLPAILDTGVTRLELCYRVGAECADGDNVIASADPMIEIGVLRFVAHAWTHRGDSPNDWARDCGAADLWSGFRSPFFG